MTDRCVVVALASSWSPSPPPLLKCSMRSVRYYEVVVLICTLHSFRRKGWYNYVHLAPPTGGIFLVEVIVVGPNIVIVISSYIISWSRVDIVAAATTTRSIHRWTEQQNRRDHGIEHGEKEFGKFLLQIHTG